MLCEKNDSAWVQNQRRFMYLYISVCTLLHTDLLRFKKKTYGSLVILPVHSLLPGNNFEFHAYIVYEPNDERYPKYAKHNSEL